MFIMDELNTETMKQIKSVCHEFTVNGDFIRNYENVYHSILTECNNQSAGIQLADYVAGAMYGYLRRSFIDPDRANRVSCHRHPKAGVCSNFTSWVVRQIRKHKWSLDACCGYAKRHSLFEPSEMVCSRIHFSFRA